MAYQLLNILVFTLFGIGFVVATVAVVSRIFRPKVNDPNEPAKLETYECGEPAIGSSWVRFDIRFYSLALIFLIFDVEVAFLFPWARVFKTLRQAGFGGFILAEVLVFLAILLVGFLYCWRKGDLDWMKMQSARKSAERLRAEEQGRVASTTGADAAGEAVSASDRPAAAGAGI